MRASTTGLSRFAQRHAITLKSGRLSQLNRNADLRMLLGIGSRRSPSLIPPAHTSGQDRHRHQHGSTLHSDRVEGADNIAAPGKNSTTTIAVVELRKIRATLHACSHRDRRHDHLSA